jgi:ubiquitin-activating enzyme E1 C
MSTTSWNGRWFHLRKVLERGGPLAHPDFQASNETLDFLLETCKVSENSASNKNKKLNSNVRKLFVTICAI